MNNLEDYKKIKAGTEKEISKLTEELRNLQQTRENLEDQIAEAIDAENLDLVEKLTGKVSAIDIKINAQKRIIDRKKEKAIFTMEELAEANNLEMERYQRKYNATREEAESLKEQYYAKMIEAGKIIEAANNKRLEYMQLAGIKELYIRNVENGGFKYVRSQFIGTFTPDEQSCIQRIDPRGMYYINIMRN